MNKLSIIALLFCVTTINIYARQMIEPNRMQCEQDNGFMGGSGKRCAGSYYSAEKICKSMNAKLPTVEDFDNETKKCGGVVGNTLNNKNDPEYKQCIINKGYSVEWDVAYWVSGISLYYIEEGEGHSTMWGPSKANFIRCVK
jgi:hypothetical protein